MTTSTGVRSEKDEAGLNLRVARARLVRLNQLPEAVALLHVHSLPGGDVAEDTVSGTAHADVTVHGHRLALHAHRVVDLQPLSPLRVQAVLVGLVYLEMAAVSATTTKHSLGFCFFACLLFLRLFLSL